MSGIPSPTHPAYRCFICSKSLSDGLQHVENLQGTSTNQSFCTVCVDSDIRGRLEEMIVLYRIVEQKRAEIEDKWGKIIDHNSSTCLTDKLNMILEGHIGQRFSPAVRRRRSSVSAATTVSTDQEVSIDLSMPTQTAKNIDPPPCSSGMGLNTPSICSTTGPKRNFLNKKTIGQEYSAPSITAGRSTNKKSNPRPTDVHPVFEVNSNSHSLYSTPLITLDDSDIDSSTDTVEMPVPSSASKKSLDSRTIPPHSVPGTLELRENPTYDQSSTATSTPVPITENRVGSTHRQTDTHHNRPLTYTYPDDLIYSRIDPRIRAESERTAPPTSSQNFTDSNANTFRSGPVEFRELNSLEMSGSSIRNQTTPRTGMHNSGTPHPGTPYLIQTPYRHQNYPVDPRTSLADNSLDFFSRDPRIRAAAERAGIAALSSSSFLISSLTRPPMQPTGSKRWPNSEDSYLKTKKPRIYKSWSHEETLQILKYLEDTVRKGEGLEKPNPEAFYDKMIKDLNLTTCTAMSVKAKVNSLRQKYKEALEWRDQNWPKSKYPVVTGISRAVQDGTLSAKYPYYKNSQAVWGEHVTED